MTKTDNISIKLDRTERNEPRTAGYFPLDFVNFRPLGQKDAEYTGAYLLDNSASGAGLITSLALPVGTEIAIKMDNQFHTTGEIVNLTESYGDWAWSGTVRLGVRLQNKVDWPT